MKKHIAGILVGFCLLLICFPDVSNAFSSVGESADSWQTLSGIGEKPFEMVPEDTFLRQEKVTGNSEIEVNLTYVNDDRSAVLLGADKVNSLIFSMGANYCLTEAFSGFVRVPFTVNWRETPDDIDTTRTHRNLGIGDVSFGMNYQLLQETINIPALMFSVAVKSDTGKSPYSVSENEECTGSGHWEISSGFSVIRSIDPIVLFGGLHYTRPLPKTIDKPPEIESEAFRVEAQPGDSLGLLLGTGFALNDKVALSFKVSGAYVLKQEIAGREVGSSKTPFYFYAVLDYMISQSVYIEPVVSFGITNDASDTSLGISYVYRF